MKRIIFLLLLLSTMLGMQAQELTVKSLEVAPMDLSASTQPRNDLNGNPCALVKVQLAAGGASFEGNIIGDVAYSKGEYWVYMSAGSYMLNIKHGSFVPLFVNFRDYDIKKVEGKTTYVLTLLMPQGSAVEKKQKLIINYTPASATVLVDAKLQKGNGHIELELPVGEHSYVIAADGYASAEASVKLNGESPRTITETLSKLQTSTEPVLSTVQSLTNTSQTSVVDTPQTDSPDVKSNSAAIETFTVNGVSFNMVRVEGGTFQMGNDNDKWTGARPVHQVTLSSFSIGETEVTQALWEAVMGTTIRQQRDEVDSTLMIVGEGPNYPMYFVSWEECQTFVEKLNQLTEKHFRLPTEAEWEYAARGGQKSRGYMYAGSNTLDDVSWYEGNTFGTHPVKMKEANELGLYDMSGNGLSGARIGIVNMVVVLRHILQALRAELVASPVEAVGELLTGTFV